MPVYKIKTPVEWGDGPEYNPSASSGRSKGEYKKRGPKPGGNFKKKDDGRPRKPRATS